MIPTGLCQCGCGEAAPIARQSDAKRGHIKGQPCRFIVGHNQRRVVHRGKYRHLRMPGHPRAANNGDVYEHVVVAERALGRLLPANAEIHHVDENGHNNANKNLVICQDKAYHKLLHVRTRVVRAGGNPNTQRICYRCRQLKSFEHFYERKASVADGIGRLCRECSRNYAKEAA